MLAKVSIKLLQVFEKPGLATREGARFMMPAGELAQVVNGLNSFGFLAYLEFKEDAPMPRGNHYHEYKDEFLYIIKGRLRAAYEDVELGTVSETTVAAGDLIRVAPRCAHVYVPLEYSQAVEFSSTPFDPSDTHRYIVHLGAGAI